MTKKTNILTALMIFTALTGMTGCDNTPEYVASSKFYWSSDGGSTYKDGTKEYEVGEPVYMQLLFQVNSTSNKQEKINVSLEIPYIQDVVSKYFDGQPITPEIDELNHITTYKFATIASKSVTQPTTTIFKFIPTKVTDITLKLTFDDRIDPIYNKQNTITFIEPKSNTSDGE